MIGQYRLQCGKKWSLHIYNELKMKTQGGIFQEKGKSSSVIVLFITQQAQSVIASLFGSHEEYHQLLKGSESSEKCIVT